MNATLERIEALAGDVGRLRRTGAPYLIDQISAHVEVLDTMFFPCAAELARRYVLVCADEELAVAEALAAVDRRSERLRRLLGTEAA